MQPNKATAKQENFLLRVQFIGLRGWPMNNRSRRNSGSVRHEGQRTARHGATNLCAVSRLRLNVQAGPNRTGAVLHEAQAHAGAREPGRVESMAVIFDAQ